MKDTLPMIRSTCIAVPMLACLATSQAHADAWSYQITPYVWAPSFDTTLDIGANPPTSGSTSIWDILDGAFLIFGEARNDTWSVLGEYNYLDLSDEFATTPLGSLAEASLEGSMLSLAAGYAVHDTPELRVEALAGFRYWDVDVATRVFSLRQTANKTWIDPLIGARFEMPLHSDWRVTGMANAGGFGVGSDFQWEAMVKLDWLVSDLITLSGGYRHLDIDFEDDSVVIDMQLSGPFVAVGFKF